MVLLPLAKEVLFGYGNLPVLVSDLQTECEAKVIGNFGFKAVDYSRLNDDNLWYVRQLELENSQIKSWYLRCLEPVKDGDHIPVFTKFFEARKQAGMHP